MTSFQYRMPSGIPGDVNRAGMTPTIEPQIVTPTGTTGAPTAYGVPLVVDQTAGNIGNMRTLQSSDTAVYGLLVRPYPTGFAAQNSPLGTGGAPPSQGEIDVLVRGYMTVLLSGTTAAVKGGQAYIWTAASNTSGAHIQGGWEAASSSGNTIAVSRTYFTGPADSNGNIEVAYNI